MIDAVVLICSLFLFSSSTVQGREFAQMLRQPGTNAHNSHLQQHQFLPVSVSLSSGHETFLARHADMLLRQFQCKPTKDVDIRQRNYRNLQLFMNELRSIARPQ